MKKIIFFWLFLFSNIVYSQKCLVRIESLVDLKTSQFSLLRDLPRQIDEETNYISNNVSNVGLIYSNNNTYISWNVCGDSTNSSFLVLKKDGETYNNVGIVYNVPCNVNIPVMYSVKDKINDNKNNIYVLYKIEENGTMIHIITLMVPKKTNQNIGSIN